MKLRRPRPRGFTLIELLVVIASSTVLIALLLPPVQSVREAAARAAAAQLEGKPYAAAALCLPPYCNSLDPNAGDVTLFYPSIPDSIDSQTVLTSGLWVTYDQANLAQQPFGLHHPGAAGADDPFDVGFGLDAEAVSGDRFDILGIAYTGPDLVFLMKQGDGDLWTLRADVDSASRSVLFSAEAAAVAEPASLLLVAGALLYPLVRKLRPRMRRRHHDEAAAGSR